MNEEPVAFDPTNEPYLGRQSVFVFDNMISATMAANEAIARSTHHGELSRLQIAATQIVPHALSLALAIRELVRQGYLLAAEVLVRPLLERVAVISYLADNEDKVALWEAGWPHKSRPPLKKMLALMTGGDANEADAVAAKIVAQHNALVHADPSGALRHAAMIRGKLSFSPSKSIGEPERCDRLCLEAASWLGVLAARACGIFPNASNHSGTSND